MENEKRPHPFNADGDFYIVDGCCTACGVPSSIAPDLFAYEDNHCYVKRQPTNDVEISKTIQATWAAELQCIRYRGTNPKTIRRLAEMGNADLCDAAVHPNIMPVFRNHVTFSISTSQMDTPDKILNDFKGSVIKSYHELADLTFRPINISSKNATLCYSWAENIYHTINCSIDKSNCHIFVQLPEVVGSRSITITIQDWLTSKSEFKNIMWCSEVEKSNPESWQAEPY